MSDAVPADAAESQADVLDDAVDADAPTTLPADLFDPAFEQYVDLSDLLDAVETLDAVRLTDCGLQMAEGERILSRSHKLATADQILTLAARAAADQNDEKTLQR